MDKEYKVFPEIEVNQKGHITELSTLIPIKRNGVFYEVIMKDISTGASYENRFKLLAYCHILFWEVSKIHNTPSENQGYEEVKVPDYIKQRIIDDPILGIHRI